MNSNKQLKRIKKQGDIALMVSLITTISFTTIYVYEILIYFSGNTNLPSLVTYLMEG